MRIQLCTLLLAGLLPQVAMPQAPATNPPADLPIADDEIAATYQKIAQRAARMEPMLEQIHPRDWVAKGAPDTYVAQLNSLMSQLKGVQSEMTALAQQPTHLTDGMKALFRLQNTHPMLDSLMAGTRKYQNPALADLIESVASESAADVDRAERYLLQIAGDEEQQYAIVDREAQRCRATLSRQPAAPGGSRNNRKTQ